MSKLTIECMYCGFFSEFNLLNTSPENIKCKICSETKMIKKSEYTRHSKKAEDVLEQANNSIKLEKKADSPNNSSKEELKEAVYGSDSYGEFADFYDELFNRSQ